MSFGFLMPPGFPGASEIACHIGDVPTIKTMVQSVDLPVGTVLCATGIMLITGTGNIYEPDASSGSIARWYCIGDTIPGLSIRFSNGRPREIEIATVSNNTFVGTWVCAGRIVPIEVYQNTSVTINGVAYLRHKTAFIVQRVS